MCGRECEYFFFAMFSIDVKDNVDGHVDDDDDDDAAADDNNDYFVVIVVDDNEVGFWF